MKAIIFLLFISFNSQILHAQTVCDNIPPVAIAGNDTIIQNNQTSCTPVPITITLNGSSSFDPDGIIVSYLWTGLNGITNPDSAITTVTGLLPGNYLFVLKVTDNSGSFTYDTIHISIVPANRPLVQAQLIPIGALSQVRGGITMAASNNKILFAGGGVPPGYCASSRVDIYDIITNSWTTAELSEARYGMGVAVPGNRIFFGGGFSPKLFPNSTPPWCYIGNSWYPDTRSSAVDIYDASSNTWSTAQLSTRRAPEGAAAGNKTIFAGGDISVVAIPSNVVNIYDASSNSWTNTTIAEAKSLPQIATAGNKMYLAGGGASLDADNNCLCFSRRIDIYDALSDLWSVDSLSMERAEMGSISANNKIYWAGGYILSTDPNSYYPETTSSVEIRDLLTNTTSFDCLSKPRVPVTALKKNNKLLFFDNSATFDIYDLTTNSWSIGVISQNVVESIISYNNTIYATDGNQVWKLEIDSCINSSSSTITASACDIYALNGETYRGSGIYTQKLLNAGGCDSLITLNLTINYSTSCTTSAIACDSYTWQGQTYTVSGIYSDTLATSNGCDSIINLDLTINYSTSTTISVIACNSYTWQGQIYTASGYYSDTLVSSNGCDSILNLDLTINYPTSTAITATACDSYTWQGQTYTVSGSYSDTLVSSGGCDSILNLSLTINYSTITTIAITACDSYIWQGQIYTMSGIYSDTLVSSNGCDSILKLNLTIKYKTLTTINAAICPGQNHSGYTTAGTYVDTFTGANGCDSIRTLNLTIKSRSFSIINAAICQGQNYAGHTTAGTYIDTFTGTNGCDSIRTLNLTIKPGSFSTFDTSICPGQSYAGHTTAGTYTNVLVAANGCDSIQTLNLTIKNNCNIYIPNAFTPNGDGLNDLFKPSINQPVKQYSFIIFNRYGQIIFETHDHGKGWDGTFKGKKQPTGSYVYRISFTNTSGLGSENNGSVLLIR